MRIGIPGIGKKPKEDADEHRLLSYRELAVDPRRVPAGDRDYGLADSAEDEGVPVPDDMPSPDELKIGEDLNAIAAAVEGKAADE